MSSGEPSATGVMIDRPGVDDRDDAIWVQRRAQGWRVRVHVARVADHVRLGGTTDVEACRRVATAYLPDRTVGMLPADVQQQAALWPGRSAETFAVGFTVAPSGGLEDVDPGPATLSHPVALSYAQAAEALRESAHPQHTLLATAYEVAQALLARRRSAGALAVYDLFRGWATDEDGRIVSLAQPERNAGYFIVQELMIAANEAAAQWAAARELPLLYRNHRAGSASRRELADQLAVVTDDDGTRLPTVTQHLATVLRPAVYEPTVGGHFGLNVPAYTHATSPLRRYPDLVNQRILLAAAAGRPVPYHPETLDETAAAVNLRQEGARARRSAGMRAAARDDARGQLQGEQYAQLDDASFGRVVRLAVSEDRCPDALAAEVVRRIDADRLLPRDGATLLLGTAAEGSGRWQAVRDRVLQWLTAQPAHAVTALATHAQRACGGELRWEEEPVGTAREPRFAVTARLGAERSPVRSAPSKRAARQQAALAMVAAAARMPDPSTDLSAAPQQPDSAGDDARSAAATGGAGEGPRRRARRPPADHPPVMAVHELAQVGALADLEWSFTVHGPAHEPVHTCTVSARRVADGAQHVASGTGATKAAAKAAAAAALWQRLDPDEVR